MDHVGILRWHSPKTENEMRLWEKQLQRGGNFKMTMSTKVCSNHFSAGYCSNTCRVPTLYLKGYDNLEGRPLPAKYNVSSSPVPTKPKRRRLVVRSGFESEISFPEQTPFVQDHDYDNFTYDTCARSVKCDHTSCKSCLKKQMRIGILEKLLQEKEQQISNLKKHILDLEKKCKSSGQFTIDDVKENNKFIHMYTGLQNFSIFQWLFKRLEHKIKCLTYYNTDQSSQISKANISKTSKNRGRKRKLSLENEFFLTLCRIRSGLTEEDLGFRFGISQGTVSQILSTWITFLGKEMKCFIHWPSREKNNKVYPKCFRKFPDVIGIIDCTESGIEKPSLAKAQAQTYSTYKSKNTWKKLLSVTPGGTVPFVSKCYGGCASDRYITETCGILENLNDGDNLMADKGFNISDLLMGKGSKLIIPPFLKDKTRFSKRNCKKTSDIAKARIHVERAIARIKDFRILSGAIPITLKDLLDDIFIICCAITNLAPPLVPL